MDSASGKMEVTSIHSAANSFSMFSCSQNGTRRFRE